MAKAKRLTPKAPKHIVRLDLTEEEATTLRSILHAIGGDPNHSLRKHADTMMEALEGKSSLPENQQTNHTGYITFLTPAEMRQRL